MKLLLVGSGGREHCLAWKLKKDDPAAELFIAPGNAGTEALGTNLPLKAEDTDGLAAWVKENRPDITVVGPEAPLCAGLVDRVKAEGLVAFGPNEAAARLEASKVFTKELLEKYKIPTAAGGCFEDAHEAYAFSQKLGYPHVIKAEGLAAGKGVLIAPSPWHASMAIHTIMEKREFGAAGDRVVVEEFLEGREASIHVVTDGSSYEYFPISQDHKRIGDYDSGPNTGGMGAYAPAPLVDEAMRARISTEILDPFFAALRQEGIDYRGILYAGLMLTPQGPKVLEFNVRFGDPETQVLIPLLESPLVELIQAVHEGRLAAHPPRFSEASSVAVVLSAYNYPGTPRKGDAITGIPEAAAAAEGVTVFQAGTARGEGGAIVTAGGRVLAVSAVAADLESARKAAYRGVDAIHFDGAHYRRDIAARLSLD